MVERHAQALEGQISALEPHLGAAAHFSGRHQRIVVGEDGEWKDPVGIGAFGEVHGPVVVDLVRPGSLLPTPDEVIDHQAPIDDLRVEAVSVQVREPKLRGGWPWLRAASAIPLEAMGLHLVDMAKHPSLVLQEPGSHPVPHPLVLALHEPVEAVLQLLHAGNEELPLGWSLR